MVSVAISRLMEAKSIEASTLSRVLDRLAVPVLMVDGRLRLVHANLAGDRLLREGSLLTIANGAVAAANRHMQARLLAAAGEAIGADPQQAVRRTAIALAGKDDEARILEMLPLDRGTARADLMPEAALAIFVAPLEARPVPLDAIAAIYALTPTEARVLNMFAAGATGRRIAELLSLKESTVKTHLLSIFDKTGIHRQAELVALVRSFTLPLEPG